MPAGTEVYSEGVKGYFGVGVQSAIGTGVAATKFQPISFDASLKQMIDPRQPLKAAFKRRGYVASTIGKEHVEGTISGPITPDDIFCGIGWGLLLGNNNSVSGGATTGYNVSEDSMKKELENIKKLMQKAQQSVTPKVGQTSTGLGWTVEK